MTRRLYLDAADLLTICDHRVDDAVISDLLRAMEETGTKLVLSREHEKLGVVLVVIDGPHEVEPLRDPTSDISLELCTNYRELVYAPTAAPWLEKFGELQDRLHSGDVAAQVVLRSAGELAVGVLENVVTGS